MVNLQAKSYKWLLTYANKIKMLRQQLAKSRAQRRKDIGLLCEPFGLPFYSTESYKRKKPKTENPKDFTSKPKNIPHKPKQKYDPKFRSKKPKCFPPSQSKTTICFKCQNIGLIAWYCKMSKNIQEISLDKETLNKIQNPLLEHNPNPYQANDELDQFNQIQEDDIPEDYRGAAEEKREPKKIESYTFAACLTGLLSRNWLRNHVVLIIRFYFVSKRRRR